MRFIALLSGGKDSCYAIHSILKQSTANQLVGVANLRSSSPSEEIDSYMYQTVGLDVVPLQAKALDVPLYQKQINGRPINLDLNYLEPIIDDEVEDLFELLLKIKNEIDYDAVCCGAIHSNYQRSRAENVCDRLGVKLISPLWGRDQTELLKEMIDSGLDAIIIKTAALGLKPEKHLGRSIKELYQELKVLNQKYGFNVCGEGGEYESMTLKCPMFKNKRIVIDEFEIVSNSDDNQIAPVSYLKPIKMYLE
ncbi:uncharacterized protein NH340_JMT03517 [Sarcoptes scabiei]|nr:uncharacterized protein NH340_JMT03517 [Sarcoptes scabiei]